MKLKFKVQPYQTNAVQSVVDCFAGQPKGEGPNYRIDLGVSDQDVDLDLYEGFRNPDLALEDAQILKNINRVQQRQALPLSESLSHFTALDGNGQRKSASPPYNKQTLAASKIHLDIEMETGTGKTYCYIKTIFEMHQRYGWSKFIVMVPSIAIREGVYKSFQITAEHFNESYGRKARFFIYNSRRLHELESFSSDPGINVMIINIQAFNARGKDNRRIYEELDDFQSRKPIDVIAANRPVLILDEPQKMEGQATTEALPKFKPLMILRYSATHRTQHLRIHRLDALDAYNQKLVKKIAVRGIQARGLAATNAYLYLEGIDISQRKPVARLEFEIKQKSGAIKRRLRKLDDGANLFTVSGELDQYRENFILSEIDARSDVVEFVNGITLQAGQAIGNMNEGDIRRIQIRETIRAHLDQEKQLFSKGIKVLSLFFIDEVAKYRDYGQDDEKGEYARIFEEEYRFLKEEYLRELHLDNKPYWEYLARIDEKITHNGYFSIDKKSKRMKNPEVGRRTVDSDDVDAYDLILKDKEKLVSFEEPTRFVFSHSALREGWDNPNVFVMCMLKHSDNTVSRRQEVGRGLRLCVDRHGDRMDHPATVHDINVLTVVASESYTDFVEGLQKEIVDTLSSRPNKATEEYFTGKIIDTEQGPHTVSPEMARQIERYLIRNDYTDDADQITQAYYDDRDTGSRAELPEELEHLSGQVFQLIDSVFSEAQLQQPIDSRKSKTNNLNSNFEKQEFKALWNRINRKAIYRVDFDSDELIRKCTEKLNMELKVTPLEYKIERGKQDQSMTSEKLKDGNVFQVTETSIERGRSVHTGVRYDLVGKISEQSKITRLTAARILSEIESNVFQQFKENPEHFISEASRIINEQKASTIIEDLVYDQTGESYDADIFVADQAGKDLSRAVGKLSNHIYDYAVTDSDVEKIFVKELDTSNEITVYAKLPRGFLIPTPVGDYNPDWAISFKEGSVRHVYFVAETKGSMSSMSLRGIEKSKIDCAKKFFEKVSRNVSEHPVKFDVVTDFNTLLKIVRPAARHA